jgi:hypothetical protein
VWIRRWAALKLPATLERVSVLKVDAWKDAEGRVRWGWVVGLFALLCVVFVGLIIWGLIESHLLELWSPAKLDSPKLVFQTWPTPAAGLLATLVCWRVFRVPTGLRDPRGARHFGAGLALGLLSGAACVLVPLVAGVTSLTLSSAAASTLAWQGVLQLFTLGPAGLGEEVMMRGLGFQAFRRRFGDGPAVLASGLLFGWMHLGNPEGTWISSAIIALVGIWFALVTARTGSLWVAAGLHVSWNWAEGYLFGQPVSGHPPSGALFTGGYPEVPGFWSGGAFGPEAAGWTVVVIVVAIAVTSLSPSPRGGEG